MLVKESYSLTKANKKWYIYVLEAIVLIFIRWCFHQRILYKNV